MAFFTTKQSKIKVFAIFARLLFFVFIAPNCTNSKHRSVKIGFYHWKTQFNPTNFEKDFLTQIQAKTLYLRLFDVDFDPKTGFAKPLAPILGLENIQNCDQTITPVVFLTNRTFQYLNDRQVDSLASLVAQKIRFYTEGGDFELKIKNLELKTLRLDSSGLGLEEKQGGFDLKNRFSDGIQFDCDWTSTTCDRFFNFLKTFKKLMPDKKMSATIRLHQVKFLEKTGVPPVERGVLMAYNMGDLDNPASQNSILDLKVLKNYISNLKQYPLKLDVALPIFSWAVVFRDGEAVRLMPNFPQNTPPQYLGILKPSAMADNRLDVLKNGYVEGVYLYENDQIRLENTPLSILEETAQILSQNIDNQTLTISFFSLDSTNLAAFRAEDLRRLKEAF